MLYVCIVFLMPNRIWFKAFITQSMACYLCNMQKVPHHLTSEAHSCRVPTTGISMFSCGDLSRCPSSGMPPALRIASLFLVLLLQLHSAKAPQRATSTSFSWFVVRLDKLGTQSSSFTWAERQGTQTYTWVNTSIKCVQTSRQATCVQAENFHRHEFKDLDEFAWRIGVIMDGSRWE